MIPKSSLDTKDIIDTDIDIDINLKYFLVMRPCILDRCDACVRINELATVQIDAKLKLLFAQQTLSRLPLSRLGELHAGLSSGSAVDVRFTRNDVVSSVEHVNRARRPFTGNLCESSTRTNDSHVSLFFFACHSRRVSAIDSCFFIANDIFPKRIRPRSVSTKC